MSSYYEVQNPTNFNIKPFTPLPTPTHPVPPGSIIAYAGLNPPELYFLCDGREVSRILYPHLFNAIGTLYGSGDGTTTFNVPNLQGRIPVGQKDGSSYFSTIADSGGVDDVTLTTDQMPSHNHNGITNSNGSHTHTSNSIGGQGNLGLCIADGTNTVTSTDGSSGELNVWTTPRALTINSDGAHVHNFTTNNSGSGLSHSNVQSFVTMQYIIKY
jgi:microcystin-dependent protein